MPRRRSQYCRFHLTHCLDLVVNTINKVWTRSYELFYNTNFLLGFFISVVPLVLPLSGYIIPFSEICLRSVHRSSRFVYLSVLEDDNRGNMIVQIIIDSKEGTMLHFLKHFPPLCLSLFFPWSTLRLPSLSLISLILLTPLHSTMKPHLCFRYCFACNGSSLC